MLSTHTAHKEACSESDGKKEEFVPRERKTLAAHTSPSTGEMAGERLARTRIPPDFPGHPLKDYQFYGTTRPEGWRPVFATFVIVVTTLLHQFRQQGGKEKATYVFRGVWSAILRTTCCLLQAKETGMLNALSRAHKHCDKCRAPLCTRLLNHWAHLASAYTVNNITAHTDMWQFYVVQLWPLFSLLCLKQMAGASSDSPSVHLKDGQYLLQSDIQCFGSLACSYSYLLSPP